MSQPPLRRLIEQLYYLVCDYRRCADRKAGLDTRADELKARVERYLARTRKK